MFSSFFSLGVPKFGFGKTNTVANTSIALPKTEEVSIETSTDKRDRRLKHLLKLNHANFSILYNHLRFHNHNPHILGSAYFLDSSADHLTDIYEHCAKTDGEPWSDSPGEIALHDYRDFLGHREYQRAWIDFFEDQLIDNSYSWKQVVQKFLFERGKPGTANSLPMFSCVAGSFGHPLIHLGYAFELDSREVAMEALGLAATCYDPKLAQLLEDNSVSTSSNSTASPLAPSTSNPFEILARVQSDKRLDALFPNLSMDNHTRVFSDPACISILLQHFNSLKITDPKSIFEQTQRLATALLISTSPQPPWHGHGYDFFLLHVLTTSHAIRIVLPHIPGEHHVALLREWWLVTLAIYIAQMRPTVNVALVREYDLQGRTWDDCVEMCLEGEYKYDEHYIKGIRAMRECAEIWGDEDQFFLKAAVRFAVEFERWEGFDMEDVQRWSIMLLQGDEVGLRRRGSFVEGKGSGNL